MKEEPKKKKNKKKQNNVIKINFNTFLAIIISFFLIILVAIIIGIVLMRKIDNIESQATENTMIRNDTTQATNSSNNIKIPNTSIGDTVNYKITVNKIELNKWRIFYVENDFVYIIYDGYLPNSTNIASGVGLTQDTDKYKKFGVYSKKDRNEFLNKLNDVKEENLWDKLLATELKRAGATAKGGVDLETWVKSWNAKGHTELMTATMDYSDGITGYEAKKVSTPDRGSGILNITSDSKGFADTLYFPDVNSAKDAEEEEYYGYWLTSASSLGDNYLVVITDNGEIGSNIHGYNNAEGVGIRPVICIPSNFLNKSTDDDKTWDIVW